MGGKKYDYSDDLNPVEAKKQDLIRNAKTITGNFYSKCEKDRIYGGLYVWSRSN